ncbi:aspartic proteinase nepenthesin-1-like [Silene latifolia]|uniref:aspartic proteinase nepenthesin-1-like n=1 Tax=Silene latifolia TaxID=37657 RepID=UPI003D77A7EB
MGDAASKSNSFLKEFYIPNYIFLNTDAEHETLSNLPECPVIVFINSKSGHDQLAGNMLLTYRSLLNENQVTSFNFARFTTVGSRGYFEIGTERPAQQGFSHTGLQLFGNRNYYYPILQGVSVAGRRLRINPNVFKKTDGNNDGTIIDSGTPLTVITARAFNVLKQAIAEHLNSLGRYHQISQHDLPLELCYRSWPHNVHELPTVTFHLFGADMVINPENVFIRTGNPPDGFCLAMVSDGGRRTLLGAYQQSNIRFSY